ncbi:condensation domain-containing protein, partial [Fibrella aquatilis]
LLAQAGGAYLQTQGGYWQGVVAHAQALPPVVTAIPPADVTAEVLAEETSELAAALTAQLALANEAYGTDNAELLLTALLQILAKELDRDTWVVELEADGRQGFEQGPASELDGSRTVGGFASHYPAVMEVAGGTDLSRNLKSVKEQVRSVPDKGLGYGVLRYLSEHGAVLALKPDVQFTYIDQSADPLSWGNDAAVHLPVVAALLTTPLVSGCALSVVGVATNGCLRITFRYQTTTYAPSLIAALAESCRDQLAALVVHCLAQSERELTPSDFGNNDLSLADIDRISALFN